MGYKYKIHQIPYKNKTTTEKLSTMRYPNRLQYTQGIYTHHTK
jgi:hypothetical protein